MAVFAVFVFGLIIGSFLNAVIYRLASGESVFAAHSRCPHCRHALAARDLIPVLSFALLRGQCRYCGKGISWQYPIVELATAAAFVLIYISIPYSLFPILFNFIFAALLILIFGYDLKHYLILDKVVFPAAILTLLYQGYLGNLGNALLGAALLAGFFYFLYLVSRGRWIGAGDVKLGIFLGALVPWPVTVALFFLAYFIGAAFALILIALRKKKMADRLPFGTFLTLAAFIAMLWGEDIVNWYFVLIGIS